MELVNESNEQMIGTNWTRVLLRFFSSFFFYYYVQL